MKPSTQTTTFTHDNMGRVATQTDDVGTITTVTDPHGNPFTITEGTNVLTRTFDNMDRVETYTDAAGNTVEYEWDNNGRLVKLTYPDNREVTYTYDRHNRLKTVTDWANRVTTYHWDAVGRLIGIDRPNGTTRTNQYTLGDELDRYFERGPDGILQAYARFGYDLDSRIDWRYRLPKPQEMELPTFTATYDNDNRVATWNSQSVTHDNDGNMTFGPLPIEENFVNYNFDARNRLTGVGGVTYTYDSDGARQRVDGAPLGVPGATRRVRRAGALWASDEQNNRIAKTTTDGTTTYAFDPHGDALPRVLVRERPDESLTFYVYGIGLLYEVGEADNATYYHFDQSGSTIALTNDSGEVTDRVDVARQRGDGAPQACPKGGEGRVPLGRTDPQYTPYGTISHRTGETDTPFLYAGQFGIHADENGLLHMRARYYSPELKRFINADPAGFGGGMNWYAYANNSPLMYVDPDGEVPILAALLVGAVIGAVVDAGITTFYDVRFGDGFDSSNTLRAALRGGFTGAVSTVATPVSGSLIRGVSGFATNQLKIRGVTGGATGTFARRTALVNTGIFGGGGGQIAYNMTDSSRAWNDGLMTAVVAGTIGQGVGNRLFPTNNMNTIRQFNRTNAFATNPAGIFSQQNSRNFMGSTVSSSIVSGALNFK